LNLKGKRSEKEPPDLKGGRKKKVAGPSSIGDQPPKSPRLAVIRKKHLSRCPEGKAFGEKTDGATNKASGIKEDYLL